MAIVEHLRPIRANYKTGEGLVFLEPLGEDSVDGQIFEVGDLDSLSTSSEVTRRERFSSQIGPRELADSQLDTIRLGLSMTLLQQTVFNRALAVGAGTPGKHVQTILTGATQVLTNVVSGAKYWLGAQGITITKIEDASAAELAVNTYEYDPKSGFLHILTAPDGADAALCVVTFNRRATTVSDAVFDAGILSKPEAEYRCFVQTTNAFGPKTFTVLNRCRLAVSGDRQYIGEDYSTVTLEGDVLPDDSVPTQYRFGYERDLIAAAA